MAIEIKEQFTVAAPIDVVWRFLMDPHQVVTCMPGATLDEVVDQRTFLGSVQIKLGAVTSSYKGRVEFSEADEQAHSLQMIAEGRETGGGTARATLSSRLRALPDGGTEIVAEAKIDLTGRIVQVGRGMIQGVSHQLFKQFAAATAERLESVAASEKLPDAPAALPAESTPIRILPLVLQTLWSQVVGLFRRLLGRPRSER